MIIFFSLPKYLEISYITFGKSTGMMILTVIIDTEPQFLILHHLCLYGFIILFDCNLYKIRSFISLVIPQRGKSSAQETILLVWI